MSAVDAGPRSLVRVAGLRIISTANAPQESVLVRDVSFSIGRGQVLALIGESGSGKTTIALALMGYARSGCRIARGTIEVDGTDVCSLGRRELREHRGRRVSYIAQSAASAFNPAKRIMDQVVESTVIFGRLSRAAAEQKAVGLFRSLALPDPDHIGRRYPHQLSGGQLQRLMAAMALMSDPTLVILDEPTTALDVTTQVEVLRAFKHAIRECGATALYVSHDLAVIAQVADSVVVLHHGEVKESGTSEQVLHAPVDPYTRTLLSAAVGLGNAGAPEPQSPPTEHRRPAILTVADLTVGYGKLDALGRPKTAALSGLTLSLERGTMLGVIGESGSGKSSLVRALAGIVPPISGSVLLDGETLAGRMDRRSPEQLRRIQIVFQHADTALNPAHTVGYILGRPLTLYFGLRGAARRQRVAQLLELVHLESAIAARRPGELSGGQKQRVNLARALAAEPDIMLCDEVTSALDAVVGASILELLIELRRRLGLTAVLISHDVSAVRETCDEVIVLYGGRVVETGTPRQLSERPLHPYTRLLMSCVPEMRRGWLEEVAADAAPPRIETPAQRQDLCGFLQRCPARIDGVCDQLPPPSTIRGEGRMILCHRPGNAPCPRDSSGWPRRAGEPSR